MTMLRRRNAMRHTRASNDLRAAQRLKHANSSAPTLQYWLEDRGGWFVLLFCALSALTLTACSGVEPKRDPAPQCVDGRVVQQVGRWGPYQTPILRVTEAHCKRGAK